MPFENDKFINAFDLVSVIGKGGFGEVYRVIHKLEGREYAVKKMSLELKEGDDIKQLDVFKEIAAMASLSHDRVVRYVTSWIEEE